MRRAGSEPRAPDAYARSMAKKPPTTAATTALARLGIAFTPHSYEHRADAESFGAEAAAALGIAQERVFKTLLVDLGGTLGVAVVPVSGLLDLRAAAQALGGKHAVLAEPRAAERRTGYVVGGISPIGQRFASPTVIDDSAAAFATVFVSGGRRGFDIELAPDDLVRATAARYAPIGRARG